MAMTNKMIIMMESVRLMNEGIIKGTGRFAEAEINGKIEKFEIPEEIHTYAKWKELGYQVRRGEKSEIKIQIWKYSGKTQTDEESGETVETGKCYMKVAAFFTMAQVDAIATA